MRRRPESSGSSALPAAGGATTMNTSAVVRIASYRRLELSARRIRCRNYGYTPSTTTSSHRRSRTCSSTHTRRVRRPRFGSWSYHLLTAMDIRRSAMPIPQFGRAPLPLSSPTCRRRRRQSVERAPQPLGGPCPELALSLMTVMHLFGVNQFMVSSYSHTATPYRQG
jgi:hypothetical protein